MSIEFHGGDKESGDVFMVVTKLKSGELVGKHSHEHAHLSVLVHGTAEVTIGDTVETHEGFKVLTIPAHAKHEVRAITPVKWLCIWNADYADLEEAQKALSLLS